MTVSQLRELMQILDSTVTRSGERLAKLWEASPILLLFLRHAGCTFCREAIGDVARARPAIEAAGARIALVHMGDIAAVDELLRRYGLRGVELVCDREQRLYAAFGLQRGTLWQLFGPKVLVRGFRAAVLSGYGIGRPTADIFQMPGLFLVDESGIVGRFRHRSAADRPDYAGICAAALKSRRGL